MARTFPIPSAPGTALLRLGVISSLGFTAAAASAFMVMTAPQGTQIWGLAGAGLFGAGLGVVLLWGLYCARAAFVRLDDEGLHLRNAALFGRSIPWTDLQVDQAATVDLDETPELQPEGRSSGLDMHGLTVGRFTLANGSEALLFVTDRTRVVALPSVESDGEPLMVLLSSTNPESLLTALQEHRS